MAAEFEWDDARAGSNFVKHGISFEAAVEVFNDGGVVIVSTVREQDGEVRFKATGRLGRRIFTVVHTNAVGQPDLSLLAVQTPTRKDAMAIVKYSPDPNMPRALSAEEAARIEAMTPVEIEENALTDPDNPPMTDDELARGDFGRAVRQAREALGLSQKDFAARYSINLRRLQDWEQGRFLSDSAILAYLKVIEREPEMVRRVLEEV